MSRILKIQLPDGSRFHSNHGSTLTVEIPSEECGHAMWIASYQAGLTEAETDAIPPVDGKRIKILPTGKLRGQ